MQIVWKLWQSGWRPGRNPRILYLADRNILIDQPQSGLLRAGVRRRADLEAERRGRRPGARSTSRSTRRSLTAGEEPNGIFRRVRARLLRSGDRRRVPPRQRQRRVLVAGDPRALRAGHAARDDRHAEARRDRRHATSTSAIRSSSIRSPRGSRTASSRRTGYGAWSSALTPTAGHPTRAARPLRQGDPRRPVHDEASSSGSCRCSRAPRRRPGT